MPKDENGLLGRSYYDTVAIGFVQRTVLEIPLSRRLHHMSRTMNELIRLEKSAEKKVGSYDHARVS